MKKYRVLEGRVQDLEKRPYLIIEDADGDGVINLDDSDIDGDGVVNSDDLDIDGDGITNNLDLCPALFGLKLKKGCP